MPPAHALIQSQIKTKVMNRNRKLNSERLFYLSTALFLTVYFAVMWCHFHRAFQHTYTERICFLDLLSFAPVAGLLFIRRLQRGYHVIAAKIRLFISVYHFIKIQK